MAVPVTLLDGLKFPEGPRWHAGRLWFSDMHAHEVVAVDENGTRETICSVEAWPSGLGWTLDERLLIVSMTNRRLLRLEEDGTLTTVADISSLASYHCNDMVVDGRGRAYIGNFGFDLAKRENPKPAEIVLVEPDGEARIVADNVEFPNGTVITPDSKTLIVGESMGRRLTAFDIASNGDLENRRVWAEMENALPDGICLDEKGGVWVASPISSECLRVVEGGEVTDRIPVETQAYACMLGGEDRRTLYICTAASSDPEECRANASGRIEYATVDIPGAGWP